MSKLVNGVFYSTPEPDRACEFCGKLAECRPYGPGGKQICFSCAQLPEYRATADARLNALLDQANVVVTSQDYLPKVGNEN